MNFVIFLDFDGVLNTAGHNGSLRFLPERCQVIETFRQIVKGEIVVSSGWSLWFNDPNMRMFLLSHGIDGFKCGIGSEHTDREETILRYVETNNLTKWIALDDLYLDLPYPHFSRSHPAVGPDLKELLSLYGEQDA